MFLREPLSLLREGFIQIVNINSNLTAHSAVNVDLLDKKTQVTVINNEKMYNLLQTVMYKKQKKAIQNLLLPSGKYQIVIGQLCKR